MHPFTLVIGLSPPHKLCVFLFVFLIFRGNAHLVSLLPAEANAVLDGEFVGGLAGAGKSGWVTAVSVAAQVSRHCGGRGEGRGAGRELITNSSKCDPCHMWTINISRTNITGA